MKQAKDMNNCFQGSLTFQGFCNLTWIDERQLFISDTESDETEGAFTFVLTVLKFLHITQKI